MDKCRQEFEKEYNCKPIDYDGYNSRWADHWSGWQAAWNRRTVKQEQEPFAYMFAEEDGGYGVMVKDSHPHIIDAVGGFPVFTHPPADAQKEPVVYPDFDKAYADAQQREIERLKAKFSAKEFHHGELCVELNNALTKMLALEAQLSEIRKAVDGASDLASQTNCVMEIKAILSTTTQGGEKV